MKRSSLGSLAAVMLGFVISPPARADVPTFSKDVAPILFNNCVSCHRPNEVAPFTLTSYEDARKRAKTIAKVTDDRFMPPWKPVAGHGDFLNVRRITDEQIKTLKTWAEAGAPEGDPKLTPALPKFADGWQLGEPDLVLTMPEAYTLRSDGRDDYRCFVLPMNLSEDKYVDAVEFRPGNRKIVHHALFFLDDTREARKLDEAESGLGYERMGGPGFMPSGSLGGWAPGYMPQRLPDGIARKVNKGSDLVLQLHMHPSGKAESEKSSIGIHFAKRKPDKLFLSFPRAIRKLDIPAGEKDFVIRQENEMPMAAEIIGITPHAHLLCKEIKVDATLPDGKPLPLIWIKDWDFNWQGEYTYTKTQKLPAGTKVAMEFHYDNSATNPAQPSTPPRRVKWGEQTHDEMAIIFYHVLIDPQLEGLAQMMRNNRQGAAGANPGKPDSGFAKWLLNRADTNQNGKIDPSERPGAKATTRPAVEKSGG